MYIHSSTETKHKKANKQLPGTDTQLHPFFWVLAMPPHPPLSLHPPPSLSPFLLPRPQFSMSTTNTSPWSLPDSFLSLIFSLFRSALLPTPQNTVSHASAHAHRFVQWEIGQAVGRRNKNASKVYTHILVLDCVEVCCSVTQYGAVWCSVVQCAVACCSALLSRYMHRCLSWELK